MKRPTVTAACLRLALGWLLAWSVPQAIFVALAIQRFRLELAVHPTWETDGLKLNCWEVRHCHRESLHFRPPVAVAVVVLVQELLAPEVVSPAVAVVGGAAAAVAAAAAAVYHCVS